MNKHYIFLLEKVRFAQVIRQNGIVEMHELKEGLLELESKHKLELVKGRFFWEDEGILVMIKEEKDK